MTGKQWATSVGNVLPTIRSSQGHLPVTTDATYAPCLLSRLEQGKLQGILSMPVEMWLEILSFLSPQDVLQLALSSKDLRSILSRSSMAI
ncbi:uncharacterized protein ARMOST_06185 [Armillaria ostoyae]|uniref:F-box domain-containing protein n=1 Tax=Armillaria ostoyae TaxID=47428 RepID=A0A284R2C3_ARMOS|nr:uncharacterized protein ARMOST_06185 [Armillaria ostoyae]